MTSAQAHYHASYKEPTNKTYRVQSLSKGLNAVRSALKVKREPSARAFECLMMLELARHQDGAKATEAVEFCKKELDDILRTSPTNYMANLAYGILSYEVLQVSGIKRFFARLFFTPLPEDLSYDSGLLHLLAAKLSCETPHLYYKLAETYFVLNNHRDAIESLKSCISLSEKNPYIDAYYKKLAATLLENYRKQSRQ